TDHRGDDPRRARRPPPFLKLPRGRPLRRSRYHRPHIRPAARPRAPLPARTVRAALGTVRGRAMRPAPHLARSRLLRGGRGPTRNHPGPWTEIRLGARAHTTRPVHHARSPPRASTRSTQTRP